MRLLLATLVVIPLGSDLYIPNPITVERIALGRRLANDRRLSREGIDRVRVGHRYAC